ncbi:MAG: hypothetical protein DI550_07085, partial [Escherichia coli]
MMFKEIRPLLYYCLHFLSFLKAPAINPRRIMQRKMIREGANKRGNSSRLTQSFHFFMFEPIFSPVNAL